MGDPFEGSRLKIKRSKEHIRDLEAKIKAFIDSEPYRCVTEPDPNAPNYLFHKIKLVKPLPRSLAVIAGEVVNALREALDGCGYTIAVLSGKADAQYCAFPFAGSCAEFERSSHGRCKDLPKEIFALFRGFKPYKGGNNLLWALNQISIVNKHRTILNSVVIGLERMGQIHVDGARVGAPFYFQPLILSSWDRVKQEVTFAITNLGLTVKRDITFFVAFDEIEIVGGKEAVPVLYELVREVEGILLAVETESRRLGFVK